MKKKLLFALLPCLLLTSFAVRAQDCDCESNFKWVKKTFEENDAGFQYIIDKKGQAAYDIHNQLTLEKVKATKMSLDCTNLLYEWLTFFRSGHMGIELLKYMEPSSKSTTTKAGVYETVKINIPDFEKYIAAKKEADYEGIWETEPYKIGIKKEGDNYSGFIIESGADTWKPGQLKLKIVKEGDKEKSTFYMRDHSPVESGAPELLGSNYLQIGQQILKRLNPAFTTEQSVEKYFKALNTQSPYLEELNATTLYLRIPSFGMGAKRQIDSVIAANKDRILKTENLIIDLRYNGGGGDQSFYELLPFLYTNTIRTVGVEFLSTKLNNQMFLDLATNTEYGFDESRQQWYKQFYEKLEQHLGEFVSMNKYPVSTTTYTEVYAYPKNIGIIINEGNASTTEQFLLAAKQSKKVKLFGTTTGGALDVSNMYSAESPCKEFKLWYCLSKSLRIPGMAIDDIGLQPDYYLDESIPPYEWVDFVNETLNQKQ